MSSSTQQYTATLVVQDCCNCGMTFGVTFTGPERTDAEVLCHARWWHWFHGAACPTCLRDVLARRAVHL